MQKQLGMLKDGKRAKHLPGIQQKAISLQSTQEEATIALKLLRQILEPNGGGATKTGHIWGPEKTTYNDIIHDNAIKLFMLLWDNYLL